MLDSFFFIAFSTVFTIVNPLGAIGPFLAMTEADSQKKRAETAKRASLIAAGVLSFCCLTGTFLFKFFGITVPALKIAGGVLLFLVAVDMLNARPSRTKATPDEAEEGTAKADVSVFPLAIPLLSGPGAIVSVFILSDQAHTLTQQATIYLVIALTLLVSFIVLKQAYRFSQVLGHIGINVMSRLMGLILASVAVQFILDGVKTALPGLGGVLPL